MLVGIVAYPVSAAVGAARGRLPDDPGATLYPGASPDVMTSSVTAPLEVQFGQMPGLNQMSSISSAGASVITLAVQPRLSASISPSRRCRRRSTPPAICLPSDLPAPPIYAKVNPADAPILTLALTSKTMPLTQVEDLADTRLAQKISQLPGVGLVSISGGQRPAVRIQANLRQLAAYGLNIDDLRTDDQQRQRQHPEGQLRRADAAPTRSTPTIS